MSKPDNKAVTTAIKDELFLEQFLNLTSEGFILFDSDLNILELNKSALEIFGVTRKIIGSNISQIIPGAKSANLIEKLQAALKSGQPATLDNRIIELTNVELHLNIRALKTGQGMAVFIDDLTELVLKEKDLQEIENKYRRTLEALDDKIHVIDREYRILYNNPAFDKWLEELNWKVELRGKTLFEVFPFIEERVRSEYEGVFVGGIPCETEEQTRLDDRIIVTKTCKIPIFDGQQVIQIVTVIRDITEYYQDKQALNEKAEKYRILVENQTDIVVKLDRQLRFKYVSPSYCETFGKTEEDLLGSELLPLVNEENREKVSQSFKSVLQPPYTAQHQTRTMSVRGWRWLSWVARGIVDDRGRVVEIISVGRDITEQKEAEEALKQSERHLRELLENINMIAVVLDLQGSIIFCNDYLLNLTGYNRTDVTGKNWFDLFLPGSVREKMRNFFADFIKNDKLPTHHENDIMTFSNEKRLINWSNTILRDSAGNIIGTASIGEDITDIRRSEEHHKTILQTSMDGFWIVDIKGKILEVNDAYCRMVGYTRDELLEMSVADVEEVESKEEVIRHISKVKNQSCHRFETRHQRKDGTCIDLEASVNFISNDEKVIFAFFRDITERKQAEEVLKASEERFRYLFQDAPIAYQSLDENGNILEVNAAWCWTLGYSREEAVGSWFGDYLTTDMKEVFKERFPKFKSLGSIFGAEFEMICKDGTIKIVSYDGHVRKDAHGKFIQTHCVLSDITARQQMEQELIKVEKLESIGTLAGGIAHDFNNILTGILGNISLAKMDAEEGSEMYSLLADAENASIRAKDLTQQLLTFSKGGTPVRKAASICEIVRDSAIFALSGSNVKYDINFPDDIRTVEIDEGQIGQAVNNLILNAVQAMPEGGTVTIRCENVILSEEGKLPLSPGDYVKVIVSDEGIGIPAYFRNKIFDPFITTKEKQSGLGLTVAYSIIKNHNGYICLEPKDGPGTQMAFYLPVTEKIISEIKISKTAPLTGSGRILILDDEEIVRSLAGKVLTRLGYEVEMSETGQEAIEKYRQAYKTPQAFTAVLMDLTIPGGMGGKEAIKYLKEIDPEVIAIVSSGYSQDPVMAEFRKYGFSARVAKPYHASELEFVFNAILKNPN